MRIGIIGAGWMGGVHSDSYTRIPGCRVVGVADIRPSAASSLAATWGARCYGDILSLLAAETPDLADICLPTYLHKDAVLACLERGVPVLCEKPIALSVADARAMCAASSRTRVPFFVAHVLRFFPEFTHMEKLLKDGLVGRPALVRGFRGGGFPKTGWENWYASPSASGGVLVDLLIHDLDFLLSTLGPVTRVFARSSRGSPVKECAHVVLRFQAGSIAHLEGSWAYPSGFFTVLEAAGPRGLLQHDSRRESSLRVHLRGGPEAAESPVFTDPYEAQLRHFLHCLEKGEKPRVSAEDAVSALRLSLFALESAFRGTPLSVGAEDPGGVAHWFGPPELPTNPLEETCA